MMTILVSVHPGFKWKLGVNEILWKLGIEKGPSIRLRQWVEETLK